MPDLIKIQRAKLYEHALLKDNWFVGDVAAGEVWILPAKANGWREAGILTDEAGAAASLFDRLRMVPPNFGEGLGLPFRLAPFNTFGVPLPRQGPQILHFNGFVAAISVETLHKAQAEVPGLDLSGRLLCAFIILLVEWNDLPRAAKHCQQFKREWLDGLPDAGWQMTSEAIDLWERGLPR